MSKSESPAGGGGGVGVGGAGAGAGGGALGRNSMLYRVGRGPRWNSPCLTPSTIRTRFSISQPFFRSENIERPYWRAIRLKAGAGTQPGQAACKVQRIFSS